MRSILTRALLSLALCLSMTAIAKSKGDMIDLGTLGGTGAYPRSINNKGQIVGESYVAGDKNYHAFIYDEENGMLDLGTLEGGLDSTAVDINDSGEVIGWSYDANENVRAFYYTKEKGMVPLTSLGLPENLFASSINNKGQMAGYLYNASDDTGETIIYDPASGLKNLGNPFGGNFSEARAINNNGWVTGEAFLPDDGSHAYGTFLYNDQDGIINVGDFASSDINGADAINDKGEIVGHDNGVNFFYSKEKGFIALKNMFSANDINNSSVIVGATRMNGHSHACTYINTRITDLGTLGGDMSEATAINDAGDIVGVSLTADSGRQWHPFLVKRAK
jgi:probable HAF family extracellular repeat protein